MDSPLKGLLSLLSVAILLLFLFYYFSSDFEVSQQTQQEQHHQHPYEVKPEEEEENEERGTKSESESENENEKGMRMRKLKRQYEKMIFTIGFKDDISWISDLNADLPYIVYTRNNTRYNTTTTPRRNTTLQQQSNVRNIEPNYGNEASMYIRFILDNYDGYLPDYTAFLHGHMQSWHSEDLPRILEGLYWGKAPYMNLNWCSPARLLNRTCFNRGLNALYKRFGAAQMMKEYWDKVFGPFLEKPKAITRYCCAQFVVSKERIRARPREAWQHWYDWLISEEISSRKSSRFFEHMWPYILGEKPVTPPHEGGMCFVTKCSEDELLAWKHYCQECLFEDLTRNATKIF